jgi:predicted dithiol-disulfide oxidoreductase (DUF899 family)
MPWMAVETEYSFEGPDGPASLLDLFEGRRQLIVYRFFYEPGVVNCPGGRLPGCSMVADQVAQPAHLNARDLDLSAVSSPPASPVSGVPFGSINRTCAPRLPGGSVRRRAA